ncbi:MAG: hypothetical protein RML32_15080, partial [Gammaproteobacteria bacterium]|nr:hypothetical protein [Gammaproteobacteria bacterium]
MHEIEAFAALAFLPNQQPPLALHPCKAARLDDPAPRIAPPAVFYRACAAAEARSASSSSVA